jgi:ACT domain
MLRMRVELADRPGALARLAGVLAAFRGDIAQVIVMHRDGGLAVDDIWMTVPGTDLAGAALEAVSSLPGTRLLGVRLDSATVELDAHLDLLGYLFGAPQRGLETFVDMLPPLVDADWAALVSLDDGAARHVSPGVGRLGPPTGDAVATMSVAADLALTVGRQPSLGWHPAEVRRLASLLELGVQLVRRSAVASGQPLSPITDSLVTATEVALPI